MGRYYWKVAWKRCALSWALKDDKDEERWIFSGSEIQTTGHMDACTGKLYKVYTPPHTHTSIQLTHTHTHTCTYTHARTHARTHACTHALAHILAYYKMAIHACMPVHAVTDAPILLHARMHMLFRHTFTWKWTHTHSFAYMIAYWQPGLCTGLCTLAEMYSHAYACTAARIQTWITWIHM